MADINVTMTVDTVNLAAGGSVASSCVLSDANDPSGSTDFVVSASPGQTVGFSIVAKNGSSPVSFKEFRYEGGTDGVFNPLPSANDWIGTANSNGATGQSENYYIDFHSDGNQYTLDPQIRLKP